jgi:hypothetical protein
VTIDEAMAKVTREIDTILARRLDDTALRMIEGGCDPIADDSGFDDVLEQQRAIDAAWRRTTLLEIRAWLTDEYRSTAGHRTARV